VPWPGDTYRGEANWVSLRYSFCLKPFDSSQVGYLTYEETKKQLLVYNFAKNGERIKGVRAQVSSEFFRRSSSIPWTSENSLFGGFRPSCRCRTWSSDGALVTWVGINDLAYQATGLCFVSDTESRYRRISDPTPELRQLFGLQDQLYERGARNFCYIDVPPMDRSPACEFTFLG